MTAVRRRKAVLGGTFNPPHVAHLIVAQAVGESLELDRVLLVPSHRHAFKGDAEASPTDRAAMAELAVAGDPSLAVDRLEIHRGGTSYTVDTLRELRDREPDTEWHLVLGQDNLDELDDWREADRLPELARIVVVTRGVDGASGGSCDLPFGASGLLVRVPGLEISSTAIRRRVREGRSIRYWVPAAVEAYIREHRLYAADAAGNRAR